MVCDPLGAIHACTWHWHTILGVGLQHTHQIWLHHPLAEPRPCVCVRVQAAVSGRPGASYVGVPSNILFGPAPADSGEDSTSGLHIPTLGPNRLLRERVHADGAAVQAAAELLSKAQRYLAVPLTLGLPLGIQAPVTTSLAA